MSAYEKVNYPDFDSFSMNWHENTY